MPADTKYTDILNCVRWGLMIQYCISKFYITCTCAGSICCRTPCSDPKACRTTILWVSLKTYQTLKQVTQVVAEEGTGRRETVFPKDAPRLSHITKPMMHYSKHPTVPLLFNTDTSKIRLSVYTAGYVLISEWLFLFISVYRTQRGGKINVSKSLPARSLVVQTSNGV